MIVIKDKYLPIVKAVKEVVRLSILAVVAWFMAWASNQGGEVFVIITALLRGVDKWVHENPSRFNGLLPF